MAISTKAARLDIALMASADKVGAPSVRPMSIGVPTAPKVTGAESPISAATTAAIGGNPKEHNNGAAMAAGDPNPEAPSRNAPNSHAMTIA